MSKMRLAGSSAERAKYKQNSFVPASSENQYNSIFIKLRRTHLWEETVISTYKDILKAKEMKKEQETFLIGLCSFCFNSQNRKKNPEYIHNDYRLFFIFGNY